MAEHDEFDFIICGGGTSGCVLAARLAEDPSITILLLEAGRDSKDLDTVKMSMGNIEHYGTEDDWNLTAEAAPGLNNRKVALTRGRFLGGSSNINGGVCVRGTKADYDDWNMPGWSGEEIFGYMAKCETFHGKSWFEADESSHGTTGPLHTEPHDTAPISELVMKAYQEVAGLQYSPDMFSTGNLPEGCGWTTRSVYKGLRSCAADFVADRARWKNLNIVFDATVDTIGFEAENGRPRARSVNVVSKDGKSRSYRAHREIIIAGGSYCSPAILLRSGIGPTAELAALNIDTIHNLEGVGKNLQDHTMVGQNYEVNDPSLTRCRDIYSEGAIEKGTQIWRETRGGALAAFPLGAFAFARMDDRLADSPLWKKPTNSIRDPMGQTLKQPTVEFYQTESYVLAGPEHMSDYPKDGEAAIAMFTILFGQQSHGEVTLRSKDPMERPKVDHKYLDNPLDLLVLAEGARYANEIALKGSATSKVIKGSWPRESSHHKMQTREEWAEYVKANAFTGYHPAGTCKMGRSSDSKAVVDERLRVHGVEGLRVVDCSIMPILHNGHTQMPAYAIGENGAHLIKEDYMKHNRSRL